LLSREFAPPRDKESGMSKRWGSYGWKALHSVAAMYPDEPTLRDREAASRWITVFCDTIVCPDCQSHFREMLSAFLRQGDIFKNRHTLFWFTVKAHNMVNARLTHPQIILYREVWDMFRAVDMTPVRAYYLEYIRRITATEQGFDGIVRLKGIRELITFESSTLKEWLARTNWNANRVSTIVENDPELRIDLEEPVVQKLRAADPRAHVQPRPVPSLRFGFFGAKQNIIPANLMSR
jgi:hypothetical protein